MIMSVRAKPALVEEALRAGAHQVLVLPTTASTLYRRLAWLIHDDRPFELKGEHYVVAGMEERLSLSIQRPVYVPTEPIPRPAADRARRGGRSHPRYRQKSAGRAALGLPWTADPLAAIVAAQQQASNTQYGNLSPSCLPGGPAIPSARASIPGGKGERVGEDGLGNVYYHERNGKRRWVIYRDLAEPSQIPPAWHAWLHHTVDVPPTRRATPRDRGSRRIGRTSPGPTRPIGRRARRSVPAPSSRLWITSRGSPSDARDNTSDTAPPEAGAALVGRPTTPRTAASCRSLPAPCSACSAPSPASASSISAAATAR